MRSFFPKTSWKAKTDKGKISQTDFPRKSFRNYFRVEYKSRAKKGICIIENIHIYINAFCMDGEYTLYIIIRKNWYTLP